METTNRCNYRRKINWRLNPVSHGIIVVDYSVIELERFSASDVDGATTVRATLLLVLFLSKALAACHGEIFEGLLGVCVRDVGVRRVVVGKLAESC